MNVELLHRNADAFRFRFLHKFLLNQIHGKNNSFKVFSFVVEIMV